MTNLCCSGIAGSGGTEPRIIRIPSRQIHRKCPGAASAALLSLVAPLIIVCQLVALGASAEGAEAEAGAPPLHLSSLPQLDSLRRALNNHTDVADVTRRVHNIDVINTSALVGLEYGGDNYSVAGFYGGGARADELSALFGGGVDDGGGGGNDNNDQQYQQQHDEIALCHLPHFFPFGNWIALSDASVVALAMQHLNTGNGSIAPHVEGLHERCNVRFTFELLNTGYSPKMAVDQIIAATSRDAASSPYSEYPLPCALLGMASSGMSLPTAIISSLRGYPQVSFQTPDAALNDKKQYELFGRTIPADKDIAVPIIMHYRRVLGVRYLAVLHVDGSYGNSYAEGLRDAAKIHAPDMTVYLISHSNKYNETVARLVETGCTYFLAIVWGAQVAPYMQEAYAQGIAGTGRHNWMFSDSIWPPISDRKLTLDSPLHKALLGSSMVSAVGGAPGLNMTAYDRLNSAIRGLSRGDTDYLRSKLPIAKKFNSSKQFTRGIGTWKAMLYDSVVALGLAACEATATTKEGDTGEYFTGKELFTTMINSAFDGASGTVAFDNKTGTRLPFSARFLIFNYVHNNNPTVTTHNTTKLKKVTASLFEGGEWREIVPFVYNDNTTTVALDLPLIIVQQNHLSTGLRAGGLIMCALIMLQAVVFGGWTHYNRRSRVVTASQPLFLHIIVLGMLIMGSTIIPLSIDRGVASERGCDVACASFPWLLFLGFNVSFSALFTKTRRINMIFNNPSFRRITVTPKDVIIPMISLLAANILILGLWTGLSPLRWVNEIVSADRHGRTLEINGRCRTDNPIPYVVTLLVFNGGTLFYSLHQAHRARKISTEFAESDYIFQALTSMFLVSFIGVPVLIIANDNRDAFFFVMAGIIFVCCSAILCLIFVPKIMMHRKRRKELKEKKAKKAAAASQSNVSAFTGASVMTQDLSMSSHHETGIKIIDHPMEQEELREEIEKLKRELKECKKSSPAPSPADSATTLSKERVCPHCRSVSFRESDVFHEECSISTMSPLLPMLCENENENDTRCKHEQKECARDGSDSGEQEGTDTLHSGDTIIGVTSSNSADVESGDGGVLDESTTEK